MGRMKMMMSVAIVSLVGGRVSDEKAMRLQAA